MIQDTEGKLCWNNVLKYVREVRTHCTRGRVDATEEHKCLIHCGRRGGRACGYRCRSAGVFKAGVMKVLINSSFSMK